MAGKISTLILTVDLECYICSKKIKKTLSKLQARGKIQTINLDEKSNIILVSGPFDPQKIKKKLLCKAGKVIKEIKIKEEEKKPPPPKEPKAAEPEKHIPVQPEKEKEKPKEQEKPKEKAKPAEPEKEKPKEKEMAKPPEPEKEKPKAKAKPPEPEKEKPKPAPKEPDGEPKKVVPVQENQPVWPIWPVGPTVPICCWRPYYEEAYGGCRCCSCGMFFGWATGIPPPPAAGGCTGGPPVSSCRFFCEEDPSCKIM